MLSGKEDYILNKMIDENTLEVSDCCGSAFIDEGYEEEDGTKTGRCFECGEMSEIISESEYKQR